MGKDITTVLLVLLDVSLAVEVIRGVEAVAVVVSLAAVDVVVIREAEALSVLLLVLLADTDVVVNVAVVVSFDETVVLKEHVIKRSV